MTPIESGRSANRPVLSVTRTVNIELPEVAGRPVIEPEVESVSPLGSVPDDSDHEYDGVPPDACNVCE
jgi:hypothetical protein